MSDPNETQNKPQDQSSTPAKSQGETASGSSVGSTTLRQAVSDLLTSKKFLITLAAIATLIAGKLGLDIDGSLVDKIWVTLVALVFGQSLTDIGKGSVVAAARANTTKSPSRVSTSGATTALLLFVLAAPIAIGSTACATLGSSKGTIEVATIECATVNLAPGFKDVQDKCTRQDGTIDGKCAATIAYDDLKSAGGCVLIKILDEAIARLGNARAASPIATQSFASPDATESQDDVQRLQGALESFRTNHANGAKFRVDGVLR